MKHPGVNNPRTNLVYRKPKRNGYICYHHLLLERESACWIKAQEEGCSCALTANMGTQNTCNESIRALAKLVFLFQYFWAPIFLIYRVLTKEWPPSSLTNLPTYTLFQAILKILTVTVYSHCTQNNLLLTCSVKSTKNSMGKLSLRA